MPRANTSASTILSAPAASPMGGYIIKPAGSGEIKTYTLIYDLHLSSANAGNWQGLFQNDLSNASDGDLFIKRSGDTFGIGIGGDYQGGAKMDEWHRIAFVIKETTPGTVEITRYIDGVNVGEALTKSADRYKFDSTDGFYILTDENNEMVPSGLSAFAFAPKAMSATEIAQLGHVKADGILGEGQNGLEFNFSSGDFTASKGAGTMAPRDAAQAGTIGAPDEVGYPKIPNKEVTILFEEDFEGLTTKLKPYESPSESGGDGTDWTNEAPTGWTRSGTVRDGGPVEFKGWTFHDKNSWVATAEDQKRGEFTKGSGVVAVVDPDEYDDMNDAAADNSFNAQMATPDIDLGTLDGRDLFIEFDSSWQPENQQTGRILVSYDGQPPVEVMLWTSEAGDNYKAAATNENVIVKLAPPAGASTAKVIFDMPKAGNNWWWAVDNIKVRAGGDDGSSGNPNPTPTPTPVEDGRVRLFTEDFEGLTSKLKPYESPSESGGDGTDWTNQAPDGWTRSDSTKEGGPVEFKGWTFHDKAAWIQTAGDQERSKFTKASGVVAVADPDEYDDMNSASSGDSFNAKLTTPEIDISSVGSKHLYLEFDSSWRPEDNQEARVWVSYDGAAPQPVLVWTSQPGETYKPDAPNEHVALQLDPPTGAQKAQVIFDMPKADNDWWWAIDNIEVRAGGNPPIDAARAADIKQGDARYGYEVNAEVDGDLTNFTLVYDLRIDAQQSQTYGSLLQLGAMNDDDGELFLKKTAEGKFGLGINGDYTGEVKAGAWARIAVTVNDQGDGTSVLKKFIDGVLVGTQSVSTDRFTLSKDGFKLMADNSGETFNGKLASIVLVDKALEDAAITAQGVASLNGAFQNAPAGAKLVKFNLVDTTGVSDGVAQADQGEGSLRDRSFNSLSVDEEVLHRLLKVGETIEIDVAKVFKGAGDLTYSVQSSDGTPMSAEIVDGKLIIDAKALGFADFTLTATDEFGNTVSDEFRMRVAGDNAYSFVVLPDTQDYTNAGKIAIYNGMTQFLADQKDAMKLQMVTHVGDVTGSNLVPQWNLVSEAYKALEEAGVRYTLLPGNHDQAPGGSASDHTSNQDVYFDMTRYFADSQDTAHGVYDGEAGSTKNNYKTFTAPDGTKWIVLSVEFGPRDDVLRWGNEVLSQYADHRAIVLTHHYTNMADVAGPNSGPLYAEGTGKNYGMRTSDEGVNDGRDIWDKMVSKHGNVSFVFSGHVFGDGAETQMRYGEQGNPVMQMFVNYQDGVSPLSQSGGNPAIAGNGGNGAMRIVIVDPDNDQVHTETYYRNLDKFMTGSRGDAEPSRDGNGGQNLTGRYREHQETFDNIDLGTVDAQFTANAGADVKVDLSKTQKITLDSSASLDKLGQIAEVTWLNENGEVVGTGKTVQIDVKGGAHSYAMVATDAQGRISTDDMVVVGVDSATLLFDNFNDGNLDGWKVSGGQWQATGALNSGAGTQDAYLRSMPGSNDAQILWDDAAAKAWTNYTIRAQIENEGEAPMGLVAYASAEDTQYRLEFTVGAHVIRLVKLKDGVRSVLAEVKDGAPFDQTFIAELSVDNGRLTAAINGKTLFGGAVVDADPLTGGTTGVFHQGNTPLMRIDDISVRKGALIADAGADRRVLDLDGDGTVEVTLSTAESSHQGGATWHEGSTQLASGDAATVTLNTGSHLVRLDQTKVGQTDHDTAMIEVIAKRDILVNEDFSNGAGKWKMIDEGELGQAANWSVTGGELLQSEDRYSRQLMGTGDTAPNEVWRLSWSPMGDGYHALRKGTYALYDDAASKNWTDYSLEFDFKSPSGGAVGAVFHYQDAKNYYKLELDKEGGMSQLLSIVDGIEKIEWQAKPHYDTTDSNHLRIDIDGGKISAWLDGQRLFNPVEIHKVESGGVGLYNWGAPGTTYDNVKVVSLVDYVKITGTADTDIMRGSSQSELFELGGGNDLVTTGVGADTIIFNTATNGTRERVTVQDFDVNSDRLDLMGADVARHVTRGDDTLLLLEGDGDIIRLTGVDNYDDIVFV